ncbi:hypothetical protein WS62_06615 [Burkholderia sp. ABCPW 14]|nr:hypothetical protein WS62_06615 [Burkholderia sp. ABCPW 14]
MIPPMESESGWPCTQTRRRHSAWTASSRCGRSRGFDEASVLAGTGLRSFATLGETGHAEAGDDA